jgi:hypothetical protein
MAVKGRRQEKKFIVNVLVTQGCERKAARQNLILKVLMATWRSEISDCVLSPQAYLH